MQPIDEAYEQVVKADPRTKLVEAHKMISAWQERESQWSALRREAVAQIIDSGAMRQADIARLLDVSPALVGSWLRSGPSPARSLLGAGKKLTVIVGSKEEKGRRPEQGDGSDMVSKEALAAYHLVRDLAATMSMEVDYEVAPTSAFVDLNRPDLVGLTSPRVLQMVSQVLPADPHLTFKVGDDGAWYLEDLTAGTVYRSPSDVDAHDHRDYAYVGRLPRPDQRGTFLYLAGIHAPGTLGAAQFLADNLDELFREIKTKRRWSMLVEVAYRRKGRDTEIVATRRVTPIYTAA